MRFCPRQERLIPGEFRASAARAAASALRLVSGVLGLTAAARVCGEVGRSARVERNWAEGAGPFPVSSSDNIWWGRFPAYSVILIVAMGVVCRTALSLGRAGAGAGVGRSVGRGESPGRRIGPGRRDPGLQAALRGACGGTFPSSPFFCAPQCPF